MPAIASLLRRFLLLAGLYYAGAVFASLYLRTPEDITLFWPSAGIGYVVAVRYGLGWTAIVPVALALLHATVVPVTPVFAAYSILGNTAATLAGAWYVRRQHAPQLLHLRTGDGLLMLRGGLLLAAVSALVGTTGLVQSHMVPPDDAGRAALLWLLGDVLGVTTMAPTMSVVIGRQLRGEKLDFWSGAGSRRERVVWTLLLLLSLVGVYVAGRSGNLYALGLVSVPLALLLWSASRFSPLLTMLSTIAVVAFLSLVTGLGLGGFTRPLTLLDASVLMLLLILVSVIPVLLSVTTHEQRATAAALFRRATRDPLTGLFNRSTFEERAG